MHVSREQVWAAVWMLSDNPDDPDGATFLAQTSGSAEMPASSGDPEAPCPELPDDRGVGNAFIGTGFSDPDTRSWIDHIYIAHWKNG